MNACPPILFLPGIPAVLFPKHSVVRFAIALILVAASSFSCIRGLEVSGGNTKAKGDLAKAVLFDDFESGLLGGGGWTWADSGNGASCAQTIDTQKPKGGKNSLKIDFKSGKGWGCGAAEASPYEGGGVDVAGRKNLLLSARGPDWFVFRIQVTSLQEDRIVTFESPEFHGLGRWWVYTIPLDSFIPELPVDKKNQTKIQVVKSVGVVIMGKQRDGTIWIDDVYVQ